MFEFEVQRCTRKCASTERELRPGDIVYSALVADGSQVKRYDYCQEGWESAPPNAIATWKSRIPDPNAQKVHWAPNDVILDYFTRIEGDPSQQETRYVLALLLLRRRIVREEGTERDPANREVLVLHCPRDDTDHRVLVAPPNADRAQQIQEELARLLWGSDS